jgi:hypothetical protein
MQQHYISLGGFAAMRLEAQDWRWWLANADDAFFDVIMGYINDGRYLVPAALRENAHYIDNTDLSLMMLQGKASPTGNGGGPSGAPGGQSGSPSGQGSTQGGAQATGSGAGANPPGGSSPGGRGSGPSPPLGPRRPDILIVPGQLVENIQQAQQAIVDGGGQIYQRQLRLVYPDLVNIEAATVEVKLPPGVTGPNGETTKRKVRFTDHWALSEINATRLRNMMMEHACFFKHGKNGIGTKPVNCPMEVAVGSLEDPSRWPFPSITGIVEIPWIRPDGEIVSKPGYDPESQMLLKFDPLLNLDFSDIPQAPGLDMAMASKQVFLDLLVNFPFVDEVDRAVAFSMLMTLVMRGVVDIVPMHALTAPQSGTGKSFLVDLILAMTTGRPAPAMETGTDLKEFQARLNGAMLAGRVIINVDNVDKDFPIQGALLNQFVTQKNLELRKLGESPTKLTPNKSTIFINGNGLHYIGDVHTRVEQCKMDARMVDPTVRVFDFDPVERVLADRAAYLRHAYIIAAFGMTTAQRMTIPKPRSRFHQWDDYVRHTVMALELADPHKSAADVKVEDLESKMFENLIEAWHEDVGLEKKITVKDIADKAYSLKRTMKPDLWDACLAAPKSKKHDEIDNYALGKMIEGFKDRTWEINNQHVCIVRVPKNTRTGSGLWVLTAEPNRWKQTQ